MTTSGPNLSNAITGSIMYFDMGRTREAAYGFRPPMLQATDEPDDVILNLFNDRTELLRELSSATYPVWSVSIHAHDPPRLINIAAGNNLGLAPEQAKAVLKPRRERLRFDPESLEDIVPKWFDSTEAFLKGSHDTVPRRRQFTNSGVVMVRNAPESETLLTAPTRTARESEAELRRDY